MIYNAIVEFWRASLVETSTGRKWDWDNPVRIASVPGSFQPVLPIRSGSVELIEDRDTTITQARVYIKPIEIESTDKVLINGLWWEVDGEASVWSVPQLRQSHVRVIVRRVEH